MLTILYHSLTYTILFTPLRNAIVECAVHLQGQGLEPDTFVLSAMRIFVLANVLHAIIDRGHQVQYNAYEL